jgi:hypothetical protein
MDSSPLVIDEIDAGTEFLKRLNAYRPVKAACWLRKSEDEERYLYVALDGLTVENTGIAYSEILRITREMKGLFLDPFRVKLISPDHPIGQAILDVYRRYPGPISTSYNGRVFASMSVAEVYIYPVIEPKS